MKIVVHELTTAFGVLYVLFICQNAATKVELDGQPERVPLKNPKVWKEIGDINQTLFVPSHPKDLTPIEKKFAEKFVLTLKHWFAVLKTIQDSELFKQKVASKQRSEFDAWITGGYSYYFQMTYRIPQTNMGQIWNMVIYYIDADGLDTAEITLNDNIKLNPNVMYEMSKQKLPLPDNSGYAYRIDKVYTAAVTMKIGRSQMKISHEIVEEGETPQFQYNRLKWRRTGSAEPGEVGFIVNQIQADITLALTEIDKRFVVERVKNAEKVKYYFQQPVIQDLRITIGSVRRYATKYQVKTGFSNVNIPLEDLTDQQRLDLKKELIGKHLDVAKADKIYEDFLAMLISTDQDVHVEFVNRIKVALVNKFAMAIMTSPSIMALGVQINLACFFYDYKFPTEHDDEEMLFYRKIFYMSYSVEALIAGLLDIIASCGNEDDDDTEDKEEQLLDQQTKLAGADIIYNDGYDFEQDFEPIHQKYLDKEKQREKAARAAQFEKKKELKRLVSGKRKKF